LLILLLFILSIVETSIYRCGLTLRGWERGSFSAGFLRARIPGVTCAACSSPSTSSGSISDTQDSKNADALRIHVFIAVAMAVCASAPWLCFLSGDRAYAFGAVIICKLVVAKLGGNNLAAVRAAEMMFLASLFTVQVHGV
jgi:hypothetical protein